MITVFVGAGNLATRLSIEMHRAGMTIGQVYSRTEESASTLATKVNCGWTTDLSAIREDADLYVFSLRDAILEDVLKQMKPNNGMWVHTAGSIPMEIFSSYAKHYGVIYPLQTFSKERDVVFRSIPIFLETSQKKEEEFLYNIARSLSENVQWATSDMRKNIHLAAVFACNFSNHMYTIASNILQQQGISYKVLLPLIQETAAKLEDMSPLLAQTGPAIRFDENIIKKQLDHLTETTLKDIYLLISQHIHKEANHE